MTFGSFSVSSRPVLVNQSPFWYKTCTFGTDVPLRQRPTQHKGTYLNILPLAMDEGFSWKHTQRVQVPSNDVLRPLLTPQRHPQKVLRPSGIEGVVHLGAPHLMDFGVVLPAPSLRSRPPRGAFRALAGIRVRRRVGLLDGIEGLGGPQPSGSSAL